MPATLGTRGKWCESKVRDALRILSAQQGFNFMRLPDARAGSFTPTTADFLGGHKTPYRRNAWMLEAKEVEHNSACLARTTPRTSAAAFAPGRWPASSPLSWWPSSL